MPLIRIRGDVLEAVAPTSLSAEGLRERAELQTLLRRHIQALDPDFLVIAEEFGNWEDSRRRIDLLALDRDANLVVIELKRDVGVHMELQALRYAAMVSPMTFEQVVGTYQDLLDRDGEERDARQEIIDFLDADDEAAEPAIGDARIVLVAGEFSKELTTTALWLNEKGLDVRCIQLQLYRVDDALIADVRQILPLPGTEDYLVRIRDKREAQRGSKRGGTMEDFWSTLPSELHPVCRRLVDWLEGHFADIWPGSGAFVPILRIEGVKHHIARFRADGEVAVYFDWMSRKPPFSDRSLRSELLQRLNAIEGIDLPEDKLEKRPRFILKALEKPQAMEEFQAAVLWWLEQVRRSSVSG